jgi:uncharacterized membrane protein YhaH (DUF805 family)
MIFAEGGLWNVSKRTRIRGMVKLLKIGSAKDDPIKQENKSMPPTPTTSNHGMVHYYNHVLRNYATFSGRARRREYWNFYLCNTLVSIALIAGGLVTGATFVNILYSFAVFIPSLAAATRRFHDVGKSGWYLMIPIYNLVLLCSDGTRGDNRFGGDPKAPAQQLETLGSSKVA